MASNWLQRMFTLPKSRNSLADLVGPDHAQLLRQLLGGVVRQVVAGAMLSVTTGGDAARSVVTAAVLRVLGLSGAWPSGSLQATVQQAIVDGIGGVWGRQMRPTIESVETAVLDAILRALGLGGQ